MISRLAKMFKFVKHRREHDESKQLGHSVTDIDSIIECDDIALSVGNSIMVWCDGDNLYGYMPLYRRRGFSYVMDIEILMRKIEALNSRLSREYNIGWLVRDDLSSIMLVLYMRKLGLASVDWYSLASLFHSPCLYGICPALLAKFIHDLESRVVLWSDEPPDYMGVVIPIRLEHRGYVVKNILAHNRWRVM